MPDYPPPPEIVERETPPPAPLSFWDRLMGRDINQHEHCWHADPRHDHPERGERMRACCHCARHEKSELRQWPSKQHGRFATLTKDDPWNWTEWFQWWEYSDSWY